MRRDHAPHWRQRRSFSSSLVGKANGNSLFPGAVRQAGQQCVSRSRKAQCKRADSVAQTGRLYNFLTRRGPFLPGSGWF